MKTSDSDFAGKASAITALIATFLYAVGLIIENLHLSRLSISDFSVLQPRYVLVGLTFFLFVIIPALPFAASYYVYHSIPVRTKRAYFILRILASISSAAFVLYQIPFWARFFVRAITPETTNKATIKIFKTFWGLYSDPFVGIPEAMAIVAIMVVFIAAFFNQ